ncbi:MAG: hypothetical protein HYT13_01860, partial [Candidatus Liptonbacteria bacterium]|nr:hypothetical protein [Candidatus Liptonbacteria bacterium]
MPFFRRRKLKRRILDVHFRPLHQPKKIFYSLRQVVSGFLGSEEILDLRQNAWRQPEFRILVVFLTIGILLFSFQKIFTRAEVVDFYPSNCLGTWQDPQNAQGEPATFKVDITARVFSASNSAAYAGGESQIFCGGFIPGEYEAAGTIKQVGITLVLQVGDVKEKIVPIEAPPLPEAPPEPELPTSTSSLLERLREKIFVSAFAQEENPPTPPPPPESSPPVPEPPSPAPESSPTAPESVP